MGEMFVRICNVAQVLERNGGCRRGRLTGDAGNDRFLRQVRLHRAALKRFSQAEQKKWSMHVAGMNDDLIKHWRRQAQTQRVHTRKQHVELTLPRGLRRRHTEQSAAQLLRMHAIKDVIACLSKAGKKPTVKAVNIGLAKCHPEVLLVKLDTLRKDMKRVKVARQSG